MMTVGSKGEHLSGPWLSKTRLRELPNGPAPLVSMANVPAPVHYIPGGCQWQDMVCLRGLPGSSHMSP